MVIRQYCGTTDPDYEVKIREVITNMIPSFIERLEDKAVVPRLQSFDVIGYLADHGERI